MQCLGGREYGQRYWTCICLGERKRKGSKGRRVDFEVSM
jgi:hypothetical protein